MSEEMKNNTNPENNNENNGNNPAPAEGKPAETPAAPKKGFKETVNGIWNSKPAKAIRTGVKYVAIGGGAVLALIGAAGVVKAFKDDDRTSENPAPESSDEQQTDDQTDAENPDVPEVPEDEI